MPLGAAGADPAAGAPIRPPGGSPPAPEVATGLPPDPPAPPAPGAGEDEPGNFVTGITVGLSGVTGTPDGLGLPLGVGVGPGVVSDITDTSLVLILRISAD